MRQTKNTLTQAQTMKLGNYMTAEYVNSKLNDPLFAQKASQALGFSVSEGNVQGMRRSLELPSNYLAASPRKADRLAELEARVEKIASDLEALIAKLGGAT